MEGDREVAPVLWMVGAAGDGTEDDEEEEEEEAKFTGFGEAVNLMGMGILRIWW